MTDWREVIEAPDVDIVDICTPPGTHAELVEAAAGAGKAIVCEKPLAADYDGAGRAAHGGRSGPACATRSASTTAGCRRYRS